MRGLVFLIVFVVGGTVATYLMSHDIRELSRIRTGKTAIATIDDLGVIQHTVKGVSYYEIDISYTYTAEGQKYTSKRFSVFAERFPSLDALEAAAIEAQIDAFATAHYEPGHPDRAILDTSMRFGAIGFVTMAGILSCVGLQIFYMHIKRNRKWLDDLPANATSHLNGAIVLPATNSIRTNMLIGATVISLMLLIAPAFYSFQIPVAEEWVWWIAFSPIIIWVATFAVALAFTRSDAGAIVLDDDELQFKIRQNARFSKSAKHVLNYNEILEVDAGSHNEHGRFSGEFVPVIRYLDKQGIESTLRLAGFRSNRGDCEGLCAWLRDRMAIEQSD